MKESDAKKIIEKTTKATLRGIKRLIFQSNIEKTVEEIKEDVEDTIKLTKKSFQKILDKIALKIFGIILAASGIIIGLLGISRVLGLSESVSYIGIGIILLIISWVSLRKK